MIIINKQINIYIYIYIYIHISLPSRPSRHPRLHTGRCSSTYMCIHIYIYIYIYSYTYIYIYILDVCVCIPVGPHGRDAAEKAALELLVADARAPLHPRVLAETITTIIIIIIVLLLLLFSLLLLLYRVLGLRLPHPGLPSPRLAAPLTRALAGHLHS